MHTELVNLRQLIENKLLSEASTPGGGVRIIKPSCKYQALKIERATSAHANIIARWAKSGEAKFVGAIGSQLASSEVKKWISESIAAFVLIEPGSNSLVAFANVAPIKGREDGWSTVEVGRLLVNPKRRREGFGSTLVQNICLAITSAYKNLKLPKATSSNVTLSRVVPSNETGIKFIERLPFRRSSLGQDTLHFWYEYFLDRRQPTLLGNHMGQWREEMALSQADLAFLCGVQRGSINMIESGNRIPSLESLWSICRILGKEQMDRVELLLAAIGEEREKSLFQYKTTFDAPPTGEQHLWLIVDTMAEWLRDEYYQDTKQAIMKGFDRFYFMPARKWEEEGVLLKNRLKEDLGGRYKAHLEQHFKFYETPDWLCYFRVAVASPDDLQSMKITVGGEGYVRLQLSHDQSREILAFLKREMMAAGSTTNVSRLIHRRFPETKSRTK